ncbi:MAG: DUF3891 family protein [Phycisphaeraceae bacterium]
MIVVARPEEKLRLVAQDDHAAAAGELARRWRRPSRIPVSLWPRLLTAIRRHDEGWRQAERLPTLTPGGRPYSFKDLPTPEHLAIWRHTLDLVFADDVYAGLIVALHARWLYTHVAEVSDEHLADVQAFINCLNEEIATAVLRLDAGGSPEEKQAVRPQPLDAARRVLGLLDALSLMLVGGLPEASWDWLVSFNGEAHAINLSVENHTATLHPWPFDESAFDLTIPARQIDDRPYESSAELAKAIAAAPRADVTASIRPA